MAATTIDAMTAITIFFACSFFFLLSLPMNFPYKASSFIFLATMYHESQLNLNSMQKFSSTQSPHIHNVFPSESGIPPRTLPFLIISHIIPACQNQVVSNLRQAQ